MKKTYISPEFDIFSFELTDAQTTSPTSTPDPNAAAANPFDAKSANHSLIDAVGIDTVHDGFYFDETQFQ